MEALLHLGFLYLRQVGLLFVVACGLLIAAAFLLLGHELWGLQASVVVMHRLSCSMSCGIFQGQGLNPCPLHWQANS